MKSGAHYNNPFTACSGLSGLRTGYKKKPMNFKPKHFWVIKYILTLPSQLYRTLQSQMRAPTHKLVWWRKSLVSLSIQKTLYSLVLFVRVLIQPFLITLTPSTLLPMWDTLALLDLFHLMCWNKWPIRFRHLSEACGLACSITLLLASFCSLVISLVKVGFQDMLQCSSETLETVPFSHEATPFFSNLIEIKESGKVKFGK